MLSFCPLLSSLFAVLILGFALPVLPARADTDVDPAVASVKSYRVTVVVGSELADAGVTKTEIADRIGQRLTEAGLLAANGARDSGSKVELQVVVRAVRGKAPYAAQEVVLAETTVRRPVLLASGDASTGEKPVLLEIWHTVDAEVVGTDAEAVGAAREVVDRNIAWLLERSGKQITAAPGATTGAAPATVASAATATGWSKVKSIHGTTTKLGIPFTISGKRWNVAWRVNAGIGKASAFALTLFRAGDRRQVGDVVNANQSSAGSQSFDGPGDFTLDVRTTMDYQITIQQVP